MGTDLRDKITENYISGLAERLSEFELGLARIAFLAGWDLALATKQGSEDDGSN
jgi:hypothetical protein